MINIRVANINDKTVYLRSRIDSFVGEDYFYDISNEILVSEKKKYEQEFNKYLNNTSIIIDEGIPVGSFSLFSYQDGILFYIYLIEEYKENDILSYAIKYIKASNRGVLYTFINKVDYEVYNNNGFSIIGKNEKHYKLKIINN